MREEIWNRRFSCFHCSNHSYDVFLYQQLFLCRLVFASASVSRPMDEKDIKVDEEEELGDDSEDADRPVVNFWDDEDRGYFPETVPRRCTDVCCIPIYLVALSFFVVICVYGASHGLEHSPWLPRDYKWQACGQGENLGREYLYFCIDTFFTSAYLMDEKKINTRYPLCVSECPSTWGSEIDCYIGNNTWDLLPTYKTRPFDKVCEPIEGTAGNLIYREIFLFYLYHRPWAFWKTFMSRAYPICAGTAVCTLLLAVIYVMFVARFVREIIWIGLLCTALLPLGVSLHLFQCHYGGSCGYIIPEKPLAWVCVALSVLLLIGICNAAIEIQKAIVCMRWSCHCVTSVKSLKLVPLLRTIWECSVVVSHVYVLVCISSMDAMEGDKKGPETTLGKAGCIAMVVLMMIWHVGIAHQISNLAMIYTAQTWFFQGGMSAHQQSAPSVAYGYWIAFRYHLGTCIYAGLVILLISPIRLPLKILTGVMQSKQNNPVGLLLWVCFSCVEDCFYNNLEGLSSHSIYDTVLQANDWCLAVTHSTAVIYEDSGGAVGRVLKEATWIFELAGIGLFAGATYTTTQVLMRQVPYFTDPGSDGFIALPYAASCLCVFVAVMFSYPFMDLFRLVSDCILYCRTVEKQRHRLPGSEEDTLVAGCAEDLANAMQMLLCMDGRHGTRGS